MELAFLGGKMTGKGTPRPAQAGGPELHPLISHDEGEGQLLQIVL